MTISNGERLVYVNPHTQIITRESADLAIKAAQQTGVSLELMAVAGEKVEVARGIYITVPAGNVRIGVGRGNTSLEVQEWATKHEKLKNTVKDIKASVGQA